MTDPQPKPKEREDVIEKLTEELRTECAKARDAADEYIKLASNVKQPSSGKRIVSKEAVKKSITDTQRLEAVMSEVHGDSNGAS